MLVVTDVFENERFIPDKPVEIPQKKKVKITIEDAKPVTLALKIDERREIYRSFCGIWNDKDVAEFKEATKDFDVIEVGEWLILDL